MTTAASAVENTQSGKSLGVNTVLQKKPARCTFVKGDGEPCQGYRLTRAGVLKMLDDGADLVADPERFCAYHARSEAERYEMAVRGGSYSPKQVKADREAERKQAEARMPRDIVLASYTLIRKLIDAKLPDGAARTRRATGRTRRLSGECHVRPARRPDAIHQLAVALPSSRS
jgi:hypothetical protein